MVDPYDVILSPWITEKSLNARRVADPEGYYKENNNRIEFIAVSYTHLTLPTKA